MWFGLLLEQHHVELSLPGAAAPIVGWIRRRREPATMMIGGRNLVGGGPVARITIAIDGRPLDTTDVPPGFFLRMVALPEFDDTHEHLPRLWARARVDALLREMDLNGEREDYIHVPSPKVERWTDYELASGHVGRIDSQRQGP